jgi:hypothetical protein
MALEASRPGPLAVFGLFMLWLLASTVIGLGAAFVPVFMFGHAIFLFTLIAWGVGLVGFLVHLSRLKKRRQLVDEKRAI